MSRSTTAVEAIAAALREHLDGTCSICDNYDQPSHLAELVANVARRLPVELVAELIGGEVEHQTTFTVAAVPPSRVTTRAIEAKRLKVGDTFLDRPIVSIDLRQVRAATPWTSPAVLGLRKIEPEPKEQQ